MRNLSVALIPLLFLACDRQPAAPDEGEAEAPGPLPRFGSAAATGRDTAGPVYHFVANGEAGSVQWYDEAWDSVTSTGTYGYLQVNRGGTTREPQTSLYYYVFSCDAGVCTKVEEGYGQIANGDLFGGGRQLHLRTNTTDNPDFYVAAGTGGMVTVDWQANGLYSFSSTGTYEYRYSAGAYHFTGSSTSASATASGAIASVMIQPSNSASIDVTRQMNISILR